MSCCDQDHGHTDRKQKKKKTSKAKVDPQNMNQNELRQYEQQRAIIRKEKLIQNKKKYMPLFKFLKKRGLKFKTAAVGTKSVEYFRVDRFLELIEEKKQQISQNQTIKNLLENWQKIFVYYKRLQSQPKLKWPGKLEKVKEKQGKFAAFKFDTTQSSSMMTVLIVVGILAAVLFPLWPYELKYALFIATYWITFCFIGIIVLRLVLYLFGSIFGLSFWIFPRLMDNVQFLQSFKPFYSFKSWQGNIYSIIARLIALSIFVYYGYHFYIDPSFVNTNIKITQDIMGDIHSWGDSKIKGQRANFSQSALGDLNSVLNQTADVQEQLVAEEKITLEDAQL